MKVEHGSKEIWCDVCNDCYNAFEQDNPGGPGGTMNPDRLSRRCRHWRYCANARCDPKKHPPLKAKQNIAATILKDTKRGDSATREAARFFGLDDIAAILEANQFGSRKNPLDGHRHPISRSLMPTIAFGTAWRPPWRPKQSSAKTDSKWFQRDWNFAVGVRLRLLQNRRPGYVRM